MQSRGGIGARTGKRSGAFLFVRSVGCGLVLIGLVPIGLGVAAVPRAAAQQHGGPHDQAGSRQRVPFAQAWRHAEQLRTSGAMSDALPAYRALVEDHDEQASAHAGLGILLVQLARVDEGLAELERAIELEPDRAAHRFALAWCLAQAGRREAAARVYLGILRRAPDPVAAQRYDALGVDAFGHAYDFEPNFAHADDIAPWERSGLVLSIGAGNQYAGFGGQLAYEWLHLCSGFSLAPYASAGMMTGGRGLHGHPAAAVGALATYGARNRWLLDLGLEPLGLQGFRFGGAIAAERVLYGATLQLGHQWMGSRGIFFRLLVGAALAVDPYVPSDVYFAASLGIGWKP